MRANVAPRSESNVEREAIALTTRSERARMRTNREKKLSTFDEAHLRAQSDSDGTPRPTEPAANGHQPARTSNPLRPCREKGQGMRGNCRPRRDPLPAGLGSFHRQPSIINRQPPGRDSPRKSRTLPPMTTPQQIEIPPPSIDDVLYEKRETFAVITLNRPVVLNAINWSIQRRLWWALGEAAKDPEVKAVILTGAGRAFSAGGDIQSTPPPDSDPTPTGMQINLAIWQMRKPVIAAVRGYAVGQGHELAGMCDLTIAADDAVFGELQIRHGFGPPILVSPFLVGLKQAKELLMLGERVSATDALRLGLVNRVVPADQLMAAAEDMARKLAALPQKTVVSNKMLVNRAYELAGFREALDYRADPALAEALGTTAEAPDPHLKVLREQGWEAFRTSRDALYKDSAES